VVTGHILTTTIALMPSLTSFRPTPTPKPRTTCHIGLTVSLCTIGMVDTPCLAVAILIPPLEAVLWTTMADTTLRLAILLRLRTIHPQATQPFAEATQLRLPTQTRSLLQPPPIRPTASMLLLVLAMTLPVLAFLPLQPVTTTTVAPLAPPMLSPVVRVDKATPRPQVELSTTVAMTLLF